MSLGIPMKPGSSNHFQTPEYAVDYILPYFPKDWKVWEPAQGKGNIVRKLMKEGYEVTGTDLLTGDDFLSTLFPTPEFDCIITNPPYSIKDDWLQRCYDLQKPWALLMPITALGEQERVKMYKKNGIQIIMPVSRINFETPSGEGSGAWFFTAWFCWGLNLPSQIVFC